MRIFYDSFGYVVFSQITVSCPQHIMYWFILLHVDGGSDITVFGPSASSVICCEPWTLGEVHCGNEISVFMLDIHLDSILPAPWRLDALHVWLQSASRLRSTVPQADILHCPHCPACFNQADWLVPSLMLVSCIFLCCNPGLNQLMMSLLSGLLLLFLLSCMIWPSWWDPCR